MIEERVKERINWVYDSLKENWITAVDKHKGLDYTHPIDVQDRHASQALLKYGYQYSVWSRLGEAVWEKAELSLHTTAPSSIPAEFRQWVNIREFQRDITTWMKVWDDLRFTPPQDTPRIRPVNLSSIITLLVQALHDLSGAVEVMVVDPDDYTIAVWIRLKSYPNNFYVCASIPKFTSQQVSL